jgi:DNA topoisomerase I
MAPPPIGRYRSERTNDGLIASAIDVVAEQLGNTSAVCRKCYVHPLVVDAFVRGETLGASHGRASRRLTIDERAVVAMLTRATRSRGRARGRAAA